MQDIQRTWETPDEATLDLLAKNFSRKPEDALGPSQLQVSCCGVSLAAKRRSPCIYSCSALIGQAQLHVTATVGTMGSARQG